MKVRLDTKTIKNSHWYGHVLRFVLGGAITVAAGLVAKGFGPAVAGFLLAFPAILPAALILANRLQNTQAGPGATGARGRRAAIVQASGAAMASLGMILFAVIVWQCLGRRPAWLVVGVATMAWALTAGTVWAARKRG